MYRAGNGGKAGAAGGVAKRREYVQRAAELLYLALSVRSAAAFFGSVPSKRGGAGRGGGGGVGTDRSFSVRMHRDALLTTSDPLKSFGKQHVRRDRARRKAEKKGSTEALVGTLALISVGMALGALAITPPVANTIVSVEFAGNTAADGC
ncbi:hypothetical protein FB451DRAFT_1378411 [Mycena latifolia]|nr:hypothetical protein FB451DRAFT_1378411 [Mycena latifolia]